MGLPTVPEMQLVSEDFGDGGPLPDWASSPYAGRGGQDRSPGLSWSGAPEGTKSYVLTVFDPDAPTGSGWWHWAVANIPASVTSLPAGAGSGGPELPGAAVTLPNDIRDPHYGGAAPPPGHGDHRYIFTISALDIESIEIDPQATPALLGFLMFGRVLARGQITALFGVPN
jgi:Raf kinase inhibitor-like YbhB/YbcL family protein